MTGFGPPRAHVATDAAKRVASSSSDAAHEIADRANSAAHTVKRQGSGS